MRIILALGLLATLAACNRQPVQDDVVIVEPAPVTAEPVFTGKF